MYSDSKTYIVANKDFDDDPSLYVMEETVQHSKTYIYMYALTCITMTTGQPLE